MSSEKFCLRWNNFQTNLSGAFRELREDKEFFDVTLACDNEQIEAHKVILSASSPIFRAILKKNCHEHPLIYLKDIKYVDLVSVLDFIYNGEVIIAVEKLNSFLLVAEDLKIKGLTQRNGSSIQYQESPSTKLEPPNHAPPPKPTPHPAPHPYPEDHNIQPSVKAEPKEHSDPKPNYPLQAQEVDHQTLGQVDEYVGEGYKEGGDASATHAQTERNKGQSFQDPKELYQFVNKLNEGSGLFYCTICQKTAHTRIDVRDHIESNHYPDTFIYICTYCGKHLKTRSARKNHVRYAHN